MYLVAEVGLQALQEMFDEDAVEYRKIEPMTHDLQPTPVDFQERGIAQNRRVQRDVILECQRRGMLQQLSAAAELPESALLEMQPRIEWRT